MHLVVDDYGVFLGKKSERLVLKQQGKTIGEYPLHDIDHVLVSSRGISLSSDVIAECAVRGIPIDFLAFDGRPYSSLHAPTMTGSVKTRREQLLAYKDRRSVQLSKGFVTGKLKNQANNLKYFGKYRQGQDSDAADYLQSAVAKLGEVEAEVKRLAGSDIDEVRQQLLSMEAVGAREYWEAFAVLIRQKAEFPGREHRGTQDPVNSLLNYGYAILHSKVYLAVNLAGLDPYGGFLHADRPGRPSLVLDLMEEFRPLVDRSVIAYINRGREMRCENGKLDETTRRTFADQLLDRLETAVRYHRQKTKLRVVVFRQAQHVATFLRGERKYKPFVMAW